MMKNFSEPQVIQFPKIADPRGNLSFIERMHHIPFSIRRTYWIYDIPGGEARGGHAYKNLQEVIIALSGSFEVLVDYGDRTQTFTLNRSYFGLYIPKLTWRQFIHFSPNSVAFILASLPYKPDDYIHNYDEYKNLRNEKL